MIEQLNPLTTSSTTWKIVQRVDLAPYFLRGNELISIWQTISGRCAHPNAHCLYRQQLKQLYIRVQDTMRNAERIADMLRGHEVQQPKRMRRAWFSVVGQVSRYLFGTLDEAAGRELTDMVEVAANNTRELSKLVANQTELIITEFGELHAKAGELEVATQKLAQQQAQTQEQGVFAAALSLYTENVLQYELDTEILTDAILFATQGVVHPRFIPPGQIENTASLVAETVSNARFPTDEKHESITDLIRVSELSILFSKFQLVYRLSLPLLDYTKFDLYKASPLPIAQKALNITTAFAYIWPENQYFAISKSKDSYIPMTLDSVNKCKKLGNLYICRETEPMREININSACEIRLSINEGMHDFAACNLKIIKLSDAFWARLTAPNTWAYSASFAEPLFPSCKQMPDRTLTISRGDTAPSAGVYSPYEHGAPNSFSGDINQLKHCSV